MSATQNTSQESQPAKSDKQFDLYTDEDPRGTIHGLGFKDVKTASHVKKIEGSDRTHAHKIQAIAMEQRARVMGKTKQKKWSIVSISKR